MIADTSLRRRTRIVQAAGTEFAARGLAGGRTVHISKEAGVNNAAIRAYFGTKEALFDEVVRQQTQYLDDLVQAGAHDLVGLAGDLFDHMRARPRSVRLLQWQELERSISSYSSVAPPPRGAQQVASAWSLPLHQAHEVVTLLMNLARSMAISYPSQAAGGESPGSLGGYRIYVEGAARGVIASVTGRPLAI